MNTTISSTTDEQTAIQALQSIHQNGGSPDHVFATAMKTRLEKDWARANGLKRAESRDCIHPLLGISCGVSEDESCECRPPHTDHASLWTKGGKPYCYVSQPYGLDMEDIAEITTFCKQHGLTFTIGDSPAFHFPSRALFVVFQVAAKARSLREP